MANHFKYFQVDYAGPMYCISKYKAISKSRKLLFQCSVSSDIHLELEPNLTTQEFLKTMKRLTARRGNPKIINSDNAKTFQAGAKWLTRINKTRSFTIFCVIRVEHGNPIYPKHHGMVVRLSSELSSQSKHFS